MRKNTKAPIGLILFLFLANTNCFQDTMKKVNVALKCASYCDDLMYRLIVDSRKYGEMPLDKGANISFETNYTRHKSVVLEIYSKSSNRYGCAIDIPMNSSNFTETITDFSSLYPVKIAPQIDSTGISDTLLSTVTPFPH